MSNNKNKPSPYILDIRHGQTIAMVEKSVYTQFGFTWAVYHMLEAHYEGTAMPTKDGCMSYLDKEYDGGTETLKSHARHLYEAAHSSYDMYGDSRHNVYPPVAYGWFIRHNLNAIMSTRAGWHAYVDILEPLNVEGLVPKTKEEALAKFDYDAIKALLATKWTPAKH